MAMDLQDSISLSLLQHPDKADQSKVPANASTPIFEIKQNQNKCIMVQMGSIYTFNRQYKWPVLLIYTISSFQFH